VGAKQQSLTYSLYSTGRVDVFQIYDFQKATTMSEQLPQSNMNIIDREANSIPLIHIKCNSCKTAHLALSNNNCFIILYTCT